MAIEPRCAFAGLLALLVLAAGSARAAPPASPADEALVADALFREGRALFDARRFAEACDKLAESDRHVPSVKTLGLLAACHEEQGKLVAALREYQETAARAGAARDPREAFARERAAALGARVPSIRLKIADPAPGERVTCNGVEVAEGEPRVEPGPFLVEASAPGRLAWSAKGTAAEGAVIWITVPALAEIPAPGTPTAGFVVGGVGLASLAAGGVFGGLAIARNNASNDGLCTPDDRCTPKGGALRDQARTFATVSTVCFAAGGAAVAAGAILLLVSRSPDKPVARLQLIPSLGGAVLVGSF